MKAIRNNKEEVTYKVGKETFTAKILKETVEYYIVKHDIKGQRSLNRRIYK